MSDIINAHANRGPASLRGWAGELGGDAPAGCAAQELRIAADVNVAVHNLPIDKELIAAVPPEDAVWIKRLGLGGLLNVQGKIYQGIPDPARPDAPINPNDVRFDLGVALHDGTLWPAEGTFSVSDLSGTCRLTPRV